MSLGKKDGGYAFSPQHYKSLHTAQKVQYVIFFPTRCPCANGIVSVTCRFEDIRTFLYVCTSVVKVFVCPELSLNVPVAVSVTTEDRVLLGIYIGLSRFHFVSSHVYWLIFTFFARTFVLAKRQLQLVFD